MEDAAQDKFVVQRRIMTGFPGSHASHKVATCTARSKPRMGMTEDHPSGIISLMGIWKLKSIYTNAGHNNETQGTDTPTS